MQLLNATMGSSDSTKIHSYTYNNTDTVIDTDTDTNTRKQNIFTLMFSSFHIPSTFCSSFYDFPVVFSLLPPPKKQANNTQSYCFAWYSFNFCSTSSYHQIFSFQSTFNTIAVLCHSSPSSSFIRSIKNTIFIGSASQCKIAEVFQLI